MPLVDYPRGLLGVVAYLGFASSRRASRMICKATAHQDFASAAASGALRAVCYMMTILFHLPGAQHHLLRDPRRHALLRKPADDESTYVSTSRRHGIVRITGIPALYTCAGRRSLGSLNLGVVVLAGQGVVAIVSVTACRVAGRQSSGCVRRPRRERRSCVWGHGGAAGVCSQRMRYLSCRQLR